MIVKKFVVGPLATNCYIFGDDASGEIALMDPAGDTDRINNFIRKNGLKLNCIINTHGHGDHISGNADFSADVLVHKLDGDFLDNAEKNLSAAFGAPVSSPRPNRLLDDGDRIAVGKLYLDVIHTPGHTPGSICLKYDNLLFSGDTLFFEGVGRTDIPNASWNELLRSIKDKLMLLPDDCKVYPGHGPETTIGHERNYNTFL